MIYSPDCARLICEGKMDAKSCTMVNGKCKMSTEACQKMMQNKAE